MRLRLPLVLLLALAACEPDPTHYGPPPECQLDAGGSCVPNPAGGAGATGSGGGATGAGGSGGGAVSTSDLTGTVHRIVSQSFDDDAMLALQTAATIVAPGASGNVTAPYGGTAGTTFTLSKVKDGLAWVLVQDGTNGGAGILSTYSPLTLPTTAPVALPVIDLGLMQNLAANLPTVSAVGVSPVAAQIVLQLFHVNAPFAGVKVTSGANGAQIAYDKGPGSYTDDTTKGTGTAGTILLFNAPFNGSHTLTLTDTATSTTYDVVVQAGTGAATIAVIEL